MEQDYDILVIGGCTAGLFFAARMPKQGYRTLVVEKDSVQKHGKRYDIFHLAKSTFENFDVQEPNPGDEDFVFIFSRGISRSALDNYPKLSSTEEIMVLHRHPFMSRLEKWAEEQGVTVWHDAQYLSPTLNSSGKLSGASIKYQNKTHNISARLITDASGISSVVRRSLPQTYGIEKFKISSRDKFYVVLYYVKLEDSQNNNVKESCGWPYYKAWIAPQHNPDGAILGVGANLSYEYAEKCFNNFTEKIALPPHKTEYVERGCTPYRRPPYSFVSDGFIAIGDAACLTNPWNGEGITAAWKQAEIAAEEAGKAMQNGTYPTRTALWKINSRYNTTQGSEYAQLLSMLASFLDCTPQENDYQFKQSIIFESEDEKQTKNLFGRIIKGVLTGNLKFSTLYKIVSASIIGNKIAAHYKKYPNTPQAFDTWTKKADQLWKKTRSMADQAEKDLKKQTSSN